MENGKYENLVRDIAKPLCNTQWMDTGDVFCAAKYFRERIKLHWKLQFDDILTASECPF